MNKKIAVLIGAIIGLLLIGLGTFLYLRQKPLDEATAPTAPEASALVTSLVTDGLKGPTAITSVADSSRLYVTELAGQVRIIENGQLVAQPFIDLSAKVLSGGEMGLLGIAFHPDLANDQRVFLNYIDKNRRTTISSFAVAGDLLSADPATEKALLSFAQPYDNHNGGDLQFGPDDYLYIASGDGGSGGDPEDRAQKLDNFFGKILRIDINRGDPYQVPADNPFVTTANAQPEIWFYGLRNPWRFSFDHPTGNIWIGDVGQNQWEEVNVASPTAGGLNFGWRCYEASTTFNLTGCQEESNYTKPIIEYDHSAGRCSVTGGYVYRGSAYPSLVGKYLYADYCGGQVYAGSLIDGVWSGDLSLATTLKVTAFGQDGFGELFLADGESGSIFGIGSVDQ